MRLDVAIGCALLLVRMSAAATPDREDRWIRDPREVRPSGHMPRLELTEDDIRALAAYLAAQR